MDEITVKNCCPLCSASNFEWITRVKEIVRCKHCGYIAPKDCFDSLNNHREYLESFYAGNAAAYDHKGQTGRNKTHEPLLILSSTKRWSRDLRG